MQKLCQTEETSALSVGGDAPGDGHAVFPARYRELLIARLIQQGAHDLLRGAFLRAVLPGEA